MSVFNAYMSLSGAYDALVERDVSLARRTTYRIGGTAALAVEAHTHAALVRTLEVLAREHVPWVVLGRGSNVLVADAGYEGCVIRLGRDLSRISFDDGGVTVTAGGGALLSKLVTAVQGRGLSGLECCVGIPGTVGGAISMDAGTRHEWIGRAVDSVVTHRPGMGLCRYDASEIEWGYRSVSLPADEVVLEATFALTHADKASIASEMERRIARRRRTQPVGVPTCGSVFKDPPDEAAARLIDACGLKGYTIGGATVSHEHANFILNTGRATAADVVGVMRHVRDEVRSRCGIDLQPEVKFLGFGEEA